MENPKDMYGSIKLLQIPGATLTTLQGETTAKRCVVIPIEDNPSIGTRGQDCYLNIRVHEMNDPKWGNTHYINLSVPAKAKEGKSLAERKEMAKIIGNLRPSDDTPTTKTTLTTSAPSTSVTPPQADGRLHFPDDKPKHNPQVYNDDLPF